MSVSLDYYWKCLACEERGGGLDSNKAAEKHTQKAKHATRCWAVPSGSTEDAIRDGASGAGAVPGSVRTVLAPSAEGRVPPPAAEGDGVVHS